jgi:hypothetical protein
MQWLAFAIAQISFSEKEPGAEDLQAIESLLERYEDVDNLAVHNGVITFYLWGEEEIDYSVLDRIREELKKKRLSGFVLSATEYMGTGKKYYYASRNVMQESPSLE